MATVVPGISKGQMVPLFFGQDAVAASQTDVQLPVALGEASQAVVGYEMPFAGSIVAVSYDLSAAGTAGVFTIGATVNGTEDADTTITVGTSAANYKRVSRHAARFAAGDSIGAEISTDGDWDGTSSDLAVVVWVVLDLTGI